MWRFCCTISRHIKHTSVEIVQGALVVRDSGKGKAHAAKMDQYSKQASDYIFRETMGREDCGQYS